MNLYEFIFKRKSTRKYDMSPLDEETIAKITAFADTLRPLDSSINTAYEITHSAKNLLPVKAPYYFMLSSEQKGDYLQNIGFMWQQMELYLSSLGLGACWLGMATPTDGIKTKYHFVIALAFGKPLASPYRELAEFKRKALSEVSAGNDTRLQAARYSPSATNSQNWFFDSKDGEIDVYQKKVSAILVSMYNKMNKIDIGIALCHLYVATLNEAREFMFEKGTNKERQGYVYFGTVK